MRSTSVKSGNAVWRGYRVLPERFEFWTARDDDVPDRFEYRRSGDRWHRRRLQP
jgi:pyridoxamine 5'-phosphate oxidase